MLKELILKRFFQKIFYVFTKVFCWNTFHEGIFEKNHSRKYLFWKFVSKNVFQNVFHTFQKFYYEEIILKIAFQKFCQKILL